MLKRYYSLAGGWPGLVFLGLYFGGLLPAGAAALLCLAYGLIHLAVAKPQGLNRRLDFGLVLFWGFCALGLLGLPQTFLPHFERHLFFGLYSTLFLAVAAPLWLDLTLFGGDPPLSRYGLRGLSRSQTILWAGLLLASAGLSLRPGWVFKVIIPLILLVLGRPISKRLAAGSRLKEERERRQAGVITPLDEEVREVAGRLKKARLGPLREALIIQGSPRGREGLTEKLIEPLTEGLASQKVPFRVVHLHQLDIKPCLGCRDCWVKKPGVCVHKDDMAPLLKELVETDLVVLAGPVWFGNLSGPLKNFIDRCHPLLEPWLVAHPQRGTHHPAREGAVLGQRLALAAVGSLSRAEDYAALTATLEQLSVICLSPLVGCLIRPSAEALHLGQRVGPAYDLFRESVRSAGVELARSGRISQEIEQAVAAPLYRDEVAFRLLANLYWETCQEYHAASRAGLDLPDFKEFVDNDIRLNMAAMALGFNPERATEQDITYQFNLSGRQPGQWHLTVKEDRCRFHEGRSKEPDLIISAASQVWVSVIKGETGLGQAVREEAVRLEGRTELFSGMLSSFGWPSGGA